MLHRSGALVLVLLVMPPATHRLQVRQLRPSCVAGLCTCSTTATVAAALLLAAGRARLALLQWQQQLLGARVGLWSCSCVLLQLLLLLQ
jgi:hypothetical protein